MADKIEIELVRAFWTGEDERRDAGEVVSLDVESAMKLVETGVAKTVLKRAAPLPAKKADKGE